MASYKKQELTRSMKQVRGNYLTVFSFALKKTDRKELLMISSRPKKAMPSFPEKSE